MYWMVQYLGAIENFIRARPPPDVGILLALHGGVRCHIICSRRRYIFIYKIARSATFLINVIIIGIIVAALIRASKFNIIHIIWK